MRAYSSKRHMCSQKAEWVWDDPAEEMNTKPPERCTRNKKKNKTTANTVQESNTSQLQRAKATGSANVNSSYLKNNFETTLWNSHWRQIDFLSKSDKQTDRMIKITRARARIDS